MVQGICREEGLPGMAPLPSAHHWQGWQDIQGTQLKMAKNVGDARVGGKEVEGSPGGTPVLCKRSPSSSQFSGEILMAAKLGKDALWGGGAGPLFKFCVLAPG